jgi:hypothetical protein
MPTTAPARLWTRTMAAEPSQAVALRDQEVAEDAVIPAIRPKVSAFARALPLPM